MYQSRQWQKNNTIEQFHSKIYTIAIKVEVKELFNCIVRLNGIVLNNHILHTTISFL